MTTTPEPVDITEIANRFLAGFDPSDRASVRLDQVFEDSQASREAAAAEWLAKLSGKG